MKKWKIWSEGYAATGERGTASLLGEEIAETFDDAVEKYKIKNPNRIETREGYGLRNEQGVMPLIKIHTDWGCRLFDNEQDARKSFG